MQLDSLPRVKVEGDVRERRRGIPKHLSVSKGLPSGYDSDARQAYFRSGEVLDRQRDRVRKETAKVSEVELKNRVINGDLFFCFFFLRLAFSLVSS